MHHNNIDVKIVETLLSFRVYFKHDKKMSLTPGARLLFSFAYEPCEQQQYNIDYWGGEGVSWKMNFLAYFSLKTI